MYKHIEKFPFSFVAGTPISGELISEKAKFFYQQLNLSGDFKASSGWLQKFKERYGIRQLTITGEILSSNVDAVEPFREKLFLKIREMGLQHDQIYNADESGLFWRVLPNKTLAHGNEKSAPGRKISKERVTFMPCANASGSHKLRLLVVGKSAKPRAFGNSFIPVSYKGQKKGWITKDLFREWFHTEFVPAVRQKLKELNLPPKALLLLDNAPGHPVDLKSDDNQICVMYLPPNCTPLIQPMDQHVIQAIKLFYRKNLLKKIVASETDIPTALKSINLKNVVFSLQEAWYQVHQDLIKKSWNPLLSSEEDDEDNIPLATLAKKIAIPKELQNELNDMKVLGQQILRADIPIEDLEAWITGSGSETDILLTDNDIVAETNDDKDQVEDDSSSDDDLQIVTKIKHQDAVNSFNNCIQWASENNIPDSQIELLFEMKNTAVKKDFESKKQTHITNFFKAAVTK